MDEKNNTQEIPETDYSSRTDELEKENEQLKAQLSEAQVFIEKLQNLYNKLVDLYLFNK